MEEETQN